MTYAKNRKRKRESCLFLAKFSGTVPKNIVGSRSVCSRLIVARALVGMWAMWAMAHPLFENLLNKGPFKIFFFKKFTSIGPPTFKMPPRALDNNPNLYIKKTFIEYYFITFHLSIIISRVYVYVSIKIGQKRQKCFWINLPFVVHVLF